MPRDNQIAMGELSADGRIKFRLLKYLIFIGLPVACFGWFFIAVGAALDRNSFDYDAADVQRICAFFSIETNHKFCADPNRQGRNSLLALLEDQFPLGEATHTDLIDRLDETGRASLLSCESPPVLTSSAFCSTQGKCNASIYACTIEFGRRVGKVEITFDAATDVVIRYFPDFPESRDS